MKNHSNTKLKKRSGIPKFRTPSPFQARVFAVVKKIPRGKVLTYKEVAQKIGSPKAYRAVGNALNKNYNKDVPCHRVIKSDGTLGGFRDGTLAKAKILKKEGAIK
ncbi:MAG: methylated-DNA-protein-cysteine methyltransferase [Candidatus Moranbacteria bacterium GW2011_GWE1_35_17]|nr:MAG: methylated-DNA-protein-cysteine methyltransferase [Candidatus Moranbacteria bacterium GW2011_GWE1_35_17]KKP71839.1 MAG: methylated-DNA-protein-cysteine methyltransferase [Candidatus Moranbacteria bacterium GW2011_GWE2_35_164]KKP83372.1 MAG: methylated-DNA-protein-cysteine methyltransferase [Candidatus Moranbacteria bacterium GW2011_GWF1_35_5]